MKKLIILLISVLVFAKEINFELPKDIMDNNESNATLIDEVGGLNNSTEKNSSNEEKNTTEVETEIFDDEFYTQTNQISFAIVIDKQKFFRFLPSIINAINGYLIQKGVDFNFTVYNNDVNFSSLKEQYIIDIEANKSKILSLRDYNKTFFVPTFNKNEFNETFNNVYFGGLDLKKYIDVFNTFINDKLFTISQKTQMSLKLLSYEMQNPFFVSNYYFPDIDYLSLNKAFLILNTDTSKSAQVLSNITAKNINPFLIFSPQFCYSPSIIFLTQKRDRKKLIIANSIINPPLEINDYTNLLGSDIRYNWLNYSTDVLVNKIFNLQSDGDLFYMSDFYIYIFEHQINYKIKLYKVVNNSFKEVK